MDRLLRTFSVASIAIPTIGTLLYNCLYTVDGGERAVIWDLKNGIRNEVEGEGTHVRIPFYHKINIVDVRTKPRLINTTTGTKDLQNVQIAVRVLHKPNLENLAKLIKEYGNNYEETILPSIANEVMKATVAQYNAEDLIIKREAVSKEISSALKERGVKHFLDFVDISITDLSFGREFTQAVEQKQVAQQEAERQKFIVQKAEQEKLANIIRAEGESESAKLISDALKLSGESLIELRRIEATKEIANQLSNSSNITYIPSSTSMLMNPTTRL